jgi:nucleoside-diphosphate-sugar epimerase
MCAVLVTGSSGQIGTELTPALREHYPEETVIASDIGHEHAVEPPYERVDVTDRSRLANVLSECGVDTVFHLATILSAEGERHPERTFDVNVGD